MVCSNYGPISLTCVASKVLERVVASQIRDNLFYHAQRIII